MIATHHLAPAIAPSTPAPIAPPAPQPRRRALGHRVCGLAFDDAGGPLVTVCGLHGGAGTSTLAYLLAAQAARESAGQVMLCEAPGAAGDQARLTRAEATVSLAELAAAVALERAPQSFWARHHELRVLAAKPRTPPDLATPAAVAAIVTRAREAHALTVVDAGTARDPYARALLRAATHVIWTVRLEPGAAATAHDLLASPLVGALAARQLLAVRGDRRVTSAGEGRALRDVAAQHAERLLRIPRADALAARPPALEDTRAARLLIALARFIGAPCPA